MSKKVQDNDLQDNQDFQKKKNRQHWRGLASSILQVLKKSVSKTYLYSKSLIDNQEIFIKKHGKQYLQELKKIQQVKFSLNISNIFYQLKQKLKGLSQLTFPDKQINLDLKPEIYFRSRNLQKFFKLLLKAYNNTNKQPIEQEVIITPDILRNVVQYDSKLNYQQDLFILKAFIIGQETNDKYFTSETLKIPNIKGEKYQHIEIKLNAIHSYYVQDCIHIISSNIPSLSNVKKVYVNSVNSDEVDYIKTNDLQFNIKRMLGDCQDSNRSSQNCFKYFGHAMELQFFNSLLQPISINRFLNYFSIMQNVAICRGLILGALGSLLKDDYMEQFSDSDEEYNWQSQIQQICKQFCSQIFNGYFQGQEQTKDVTQIGRNIWHQKRQNHTSVYGIVQKHWCS